MGLIPRETMLTVRDGPPSTPAEKDRGSAACGLVERPDRGDPLMLLVRVIGGAASVRWVLWVFGSVAAARMDEDTGVAIDPELEAGLRWVPCCSPTIFNQLPNQFTDASKVGSRAFRPHRIGVPASSCCP